MSLIRGDAHANSRRWLTSSQHSLYSDEDNLLPAASSVLPDRGDEFWDKINPIRHVQQFLEDEGLIIKIKATSVVRSWQFYRSSTRLPVFRNVVRIALWGGFRLSARWYPRPEHFLAQEWFEMPFSERENKRFVRIAAERYSLRRQADTGICQSPTARGYVSYGDKRMSGNAMERGA